MRGIQKNFSSMSSLPKNVDRINVRVAVRVRPMNDAERCDGATSIIKVEEKKMMVTCKAKTFSAFDKVYGPSINQERIYDDMVSPQVERVLAGYNCTLFAYGQTGTGKTYTMEGGQSDSISYKRDPTTGIIPRAVEHIFAELEKSNTEEYSVRVSYLELYNEELYDLLAPTSDDRERLRIFDDPSKKGVVVIAGAEELPVRNRHEVYDLLKRGAEKRTTAATLMNMNSSRSHSIFIISVVVRENASNGEELVKQGKLNLVDLAGSEHIGRSGAEGKRAKEAGNINQSLLTLGRVITALTTSAPHVPYRESKLTRLLQDSLGGSTITSIIATLSPASTNYEESVSTLEYAARAKSIRNHPECNLKLSRKALLKEYNEEIEKLRRDLRTAREKNGIYLSKESFSGMENEIMAKTEQLRELEGQLDAAVGKLQKFVEDQEMMDEQYTKLYHRNKRLEAKLQQRINELDDTKKELTITDDRLRVVECAFNETYDLAVHLQRCLRETRDIVYDQQLDLEDWWTKEESLFKMLVANKRFLNETRSKVISEITTCCAELTEFISKCANNRASLNENIAMNLSTLNEYIDKCKESAKNTSSVLHQCIDETEKMCCAMKSKTAMRCEESRSISGKLNSLIENNYSSGEEISKLLHSLKTQMLTMSQITEKLKNEFETMVKEKEESTKKDLSERLNRAEELRLSRKHRTMKLIELANAIVAECHLYNDEDEKALAGMVSRDHAMFESTFGHLHKIQDIVQQHNDIVFESISNTNADLNEASSLHDCRTSSADSVLRDTCSRVDEMSESLENEMGRFAVEIIDRNVCAVGQSQDLLVSIEDSAEQIKNVSGNIEMERLEYQDEQVKNEKAVVQHVRDHLGAVNKGMSIMVEENWLSPEKSGKTPKKSHRPLSEDSELPHVPSKDEILSLKSSEISQKSSKRTRESLLEVQNTILSPNTLAVSRKILLEDIGEESGVSRRSEDVHTKANAENYDQNSSMR